MSEQADRAKWLLIGVAGKLTAENEALHKELNTCRAALDKTALERDGFHGELVAAQGLAIRLGLQLQDAMKAVVVLRQMQAAHRECRYDSAQWMEWMAMPLPEPPKET